MSRSAVELDLFHIEKETPNRSQSSKRFDRRRSFRDIQSMVSKLNPELLKNLIASGSADLSLTAKSPESSESSASEKCFSLPSTPKHDESLSPSLPVHTATFRPESEKDNEAAPLTIFYNGTVTVFEVPQEKAENIMKLAEVVSKSAKPTTSPADGQIFKTIEGDLPLARRKSLQRFLMKRKERLNMVLPYGSPTDFALSAQFSTRTGPN